MTDASAPSSAGRTAVVRVAATALFLAFGFAFIDRLNGAIWADACFDGKVLGRSIRLIRAGHDPYAMLFGRNPPITELPLVQPPQVAMMLEVIAETPISVGTFDAFFLTMIASAILGAIVASSRLFIDSTVSGAVLGFGLFAGMLCGGGMISAVTGNQSGLFLGLIFICMLVGFRRSDWRLFHAAVLFAVLFKPYFASFWIIPVLQSGWSWRELWKGTALAFFAGLVYWGCASARPEFVTAFLDVNASRHVLGDVGAGLYALTYERGEDISMRGLLVHAVYALIVLGLVMTSTAKGTMRLAGLAIASVAISPRMNAYEYAFTAIPIFYVMNARGRQLMPVWGERLALMGSLLIGGFTMLLYLTQRRWTNVILVGLMFGAIVLVTQWPRIVRLVGARDQRLLGA